MDTLSIFCIVLGLWIIVKRTSLVFAPGATLRRYDRLVLSTDTRIRIAGIVIAVLGVFLFLLPAGEKILEKVPWVMGCTMVFLALGCLTLPGWTRRRIRALVNFVDSSVGDIGLRIIGVLSVLIGLLLVYVGAYVL